MPVTYRIHPAIGVTRVGDMTTMIAEVTLSVAREQYPTKSKQK